MSGNQRYLQRVDTRQNTDLTNQTIQDILQTNQLPDPLNDTESSDNDSSDTDSIDTVIDNLLTDIVNSEDNNSNTDTNGDEHSEGDNPSDSDTLINKTMATTADIEGLFKKFVKTKTQTINALDPETFSGNTQENANEWINKFEDYCTIQKITDESEKTLIFAALLKSGAHCWYNNLSDTKKQTWAALKTSFKDSYGDSNKWICQYRIENRKLKQGETCDKYIEDMTNLSLLAGMKQDELSKCLIRGLPEDLKWNVIAFNPKTIEDTIERILLAESSYTWKLKEQCNTMEERLVTHRINENIEKLSGKFAELESNFQECKKSIAEQAKKEDMKTPRPHNGNASTYRACRICGRNNHTEARCFQRDRRPRGNQYYQPPPPPAQPYQPQQWQQQHAEIHPAQQSVYDPYYHAQQPKNDHGSYV